VSLLTYKQFKTLLL